LLQVSVLERQSPPNRAEKLQDTGPVPQIADFCNKILMKLSVAAADASGEPLETVYRPDCDEISEP
jgi:hypothetical protein